MKYADDNADYGDDDIKSKKTIVIKYVKDNKIGK